MPTSTLPASHTSPADPVEAFAPPMRADVSGPEGMLRDGDVALYENDLPDTYSE